MMMMAVMMKNHDDDDDDDVTLHADHHVAHRSTFDRLQSAVHDDVAHANVTADGDDAKLNAQHIGAQMSCLGNESRNEGIEKELLPHGLQALFLPRHVAIIMDGNSRWAEEKGLHRNAGHEAGVDALKLIVRLSSQWGLKALTVFGFSTENWHRSQVPRRYPNSFFPPPMFLLPV
jgi:hypothetical protein